MSAEPSTQPELRTQLTAIADCAKAAEGSGVPVIADGGLRTSGDLAKALADVQTAYAEGEAAFKKGDWAAYGAAQTKLKAAIEKALALQQGAGTGGTGSLTPTATATTTATTPATSTATSTGG